MLDVEKFLVALRSNKDVDGKLKPIHLADTVQEEIKIIQAAVENSRREWIGLTDEEMRECAQAMNAEPLAEGWSELIKLARAIEAKLKENNCGH